MTCQWRSNLSSRLRLAAVVVGVASSLSVGCATTTVQPRLAVSAACDFPERDLTRAWAERRYWCVPDGIRLAHHDAAPASPQGGAVASFGPDFFGPRP